jgi:hypothetical protein
VADLADSCAILRKALEGRTIGGDRIHQVVGCDLPVVIERPARPGGAAALAADLDVGGPPSHAAYLLVNHAQGWCLADHILETSWTHGGYCEAAFKLSWAPAEPAAPAVLDVIAQRICHRPLDQQEVRAGESDEAFRECRRLTFRDDPVARAMTRQSNEEIAGTCPVP